MLTGKRIRGILRYTQERENKLRREKMEERNLKSEILRAIELRAKRFRDLANSLDDIVIWGIETERYTVHQGASIAEQTIEGYMATINNEELSELIKELELEVTK